MSAQEMSGPSSGGNPDLEIPPWVKTLQPVSDKITEIRGANWDHLTRVREIGIIFSECENFCEWLKAIKTSDGKEPTSIVLSKEYLDPDLYSALKQIDESKYQGQDLNHVIEHVTHLTDDAADVADVLLGPDEDKWEQMVLEAKKLLEKKRYE